MIKKILSLVIAFCIITFIFGVIYAAVQQDYRQSANDPQIQMAEDAARVLKGGAVPADIMRSMSKIDMSESLMPYLMILDAKGTVLESSAQLGNRIPIPPQGVLQASMYGENRLTWEPEKDVRQAIVVVSYYTGPDGGTFENDGGGFIVAGRNLREVEIREAHLTVMIIVGWALSVLGLIVLFVISLF